MRHVTIAVLTAGALAGCASSEPEPRADGSAQASPGVASAGPRADLLTHEEYAQQAAKLVHPIMTRTRPRADAPHARGRRNAYRQVNLVANRPEFNPTVMVDPLLLDGWGITIRPAGEGGHFWITNAGSGTTTTYVGDVSGVPLYQDELKVVTIPTSRLFYPHPDKESQPTGQVYTGHSLTDFVVSGEGITGPSKFVFVTMDGNVSGWTTGQTAAVAMFDHSVEASMFTGCAVTDYPSGNRLFIADMGLESFIVLDHEFKRVRIAGDFKHPEQATDTYGPYNFWYHAGEVYTTFARIGDDPGEEDAYPGYGYLGVFDTEGRFLRAFEHRLELNAPWGMAIAPDDFGALSGTLLVSNFGDGTIVAFDRDTGRYIDYVRDEQGAPIMIDGIWGVLFGNGVRLGRTNHLYFAAGPNLEQDGVFGKLEPLDP
ncbi:MAG: TIGR03118 family protein [Phycisphaerales bacterium]